MVRRALLMVVLLLLPSGVEAAGYTVRPGDTLSAIAQRANVSIQALAAANHITNINLIQVGRVLLIPEAAAPTVSYQSHWYKVRWGDTLTGIGARYGVSVATLQALNPRLGQYLITGQWLKVCGACVASAASAPAASSQAVIYIVRPGDTLSSIAARYGVSMSSLVASNRIANVNLVRSGARLAIPGGGSTPTYASTYDPWNARSVLAEYADYYGVPRALAYAVAWQESGFNQSAISQTGAIGVMQVEPYTGITIDRLLGRSLNLYNITDNIQAGVYWLSHLIAYYGGNERLAVAAYYQGTRSVDRRGFFGDTVRYVDDVFSLTAQFGG